jgi:D-aspartate ligase
MAGQPLACVLGDLDLIHCLGLARIPVVPAVLDPRDPAVHSRHARGFLHIPPLRGDPAELVKALCDFAVRQEQKPVLYYQQDSSLLTLSRHRRELGACFHLMLPDAELVEDTVDKSRFAALAARHHLPVPVTLTLEPGSDVAGQLQRWEHFPAVLKPAQRPGWFESALSRTFSKRQKALPLLRREDLEALLPALLAHDQPVVLQACVEGGEHRILSYHAYVRPGGERVGEFTGRKVRTWSRTNGLSTCVETTDDGEVRELGQDLLARLHFHGVVKIDFKRDARTERLFLLEVNPRFNLWHYPGAVAGVNLPQLVYQDLLEPGSARGGRARPGVRYVALAADFFAFREYHAAGELGMLAWLRSVAGADVYRELTLDDPVTSAYQCLELAGRALSRASGNSHGKEAHS